MSKTRATAEVTYRRAADADLPRLFEVYRAALNGYLVPAGQEPVLEQNDQQPVYEHLLRHDGERLWVAERDGEVVAWGSGLVRGDWWFLADLFVLPEAQGRGVGARLFELAGTGAPAGAVRATVTDSLQPISNTLYAHRGLLPREVLVGFGGKPREGLRTPRSGYARAGRPDRRVHPGAARDRRRGERPRPRRRPRVLPDQRRPARLALPPPPAAPSPT